MLPKLGGGDILFEVPDEERAGRLRMVLVQLSLVRPKLVVLDIVSLIRSDLDLAAEEQLVVGDLQCLLHVLGLLEAHQGVPVTSRTDDLHPRHFPVLLVFVEEAVLEGCVAAACWQITYADRERPAVLGDGGISGAVRRAARRRAAAGSAAGGAAAAAAAAATGTAAATWRAASAPRFSPLFFVLS